MYDPYKTLSEKHVLTNGLEIHADHWDRPWLHIGFVIHAGAKDDPSDLPGLAHFVEHCVSENAANDITKKDILDFFESVGGSSKLGSTSYTHTGYSFFIPADRSILRDALRIFGAMLINATITKNVEEARAIIDREFKDEYPFKQRLEWDMQIQNILFKGYPLEHYNRPIGMPHGFLRATIDDLQRFYIKHYVPANISVVAIGGLPTDIIMDELTASPFGKTFSGVRNPLPQEWGAVPVPEKNALDIKVSDYVSFTLERAEYMSRFLIPHNIPTHALFAFTDGVATLLNQKIREERQLAYSSDVSFFRYPEVRQITIRSTVVPESISLIGDIVRESIDIMTEDQKRFEKAKQQLRYSLLMPDMSGKGLLGECMRELGNDHSITTISSVIEKIDAVSFEQMADIAKLFSPTQQLTVITRP